MGYTCPRKKRHLSTFNFNMERILIQLVKFSLFATLFYVVGILFLGIFVSPRLLKNLPNCYRDTYFRLNDISKKDSLDILFLGSSHAYRGFDTRFFATYGYTSFNLGTSSQTPIQTNYLLKKHLPHLHPKLIIYEVNPEILASDGIESTLDIISNAPLDFSTVGLLQKTSTNIKIYNTFIYHCFKQFFNIKTNVAEFVNDSDNYIDGQGYVEKQSIEFIKTPNDVIKYTIREDQLQAFNEIISTFKKLNFNYILVQAPVTKNELKTYTNNSEVDSLFNSYGRYYNFNKTNTPLSDSLHFYESHHLNQTGVIIFNKKLIEELRL